MRHGKRESNISRALFGRQLGAGRRDVWRAGSKTEGARKFIRILARLRRFAKHIYEAPERNRRQRGLNERNRVRAMSSRQRIRYSRWYNYGTSSNPARAGFRPR